KRTPTDKSELLAIQSTIVRALSSFGISVEPADITRGPAITRYEVRPVDGLRVSRIANLDADIARATKAERINILAPIPGKDTVGIELANKDKIVVPLRELLEDDVFVNGKSKLPVALGKDVYGKTIIGDLAAMPHLLVAGATGSGKSVCINSIVSSLLCRFAPDELRFIMIDPKVVEMQLYNSLPHMVIPVVTDPKKVLLALRWVINEMERRYAMFAKLGTRNFDGFNSRNKQRREANVGEPSASNGASRKKGGGAPLIIESLADESIEAELDEPVLAAHAVKINDDSDIVGFGDEEDLNEEDQLLSAELPLPVREVAPRRDEEEIPDHLPYIVVIIDELADLMQTAPADVETAIARIAQKARA
ncbi:MAG: DNA translocase FtsK, partial [Verrucomicrobiae bacterium]|nr:DNA translocase FtsK [Verrucomicrobiae bacterium]